MARLGFFIGSDARRPVVLYRNGMVPKLQDSDNSGYWVLGTRQYVYYWVRDSTCTHPLQLSLA